MENSSEYEGLWAMAPTFFFPIFASQQIALIPHRILSWHHQVSNYRNKWLRVVQAIRVHDRRLPATLTRAHQVIVTMQNPSASDFPQASFR